MLLTTARNGASATGLNGTREPLLQEANYGNRITRPDYYNAFNLNNAFVVPRRGWDERTSLFLSQTASRQSSAALSWWIGNAPLVVLATLIEKHSLASTALKTDIAMMFDPEDIAFEAVETVTQPDGTQTEAVNSEGTQELAALEKRLPADLGGFVGILTTLGKQQSAFGMGCLEAVPGEGGLVDLPTFHPLTVRWVDLEGGGRTAQQQKNGSGEWVDLPAETCYCVPWHGSRDNPYGEPHYGPLLGEGLADISEEKDLRDWLHTMAWPRLSVTFPYDEAVKFALENPSKLVDANGDPLTSSQYADAKFRSFADKFKAIKADDFILLVKGASAQPLNTATAQGLVPFFDRRVQRIANACDILPGLIGYTFGGTQAYSKEQLRAQAKKWGSRRHWAINILCKAFDLHFRLLGMPFRARPKCAPILPSDRLADAQAEEIEIRNVREKVSLGFLSAEDASIALTGSGVVDEDKAVRIGEPVATAATADPKADPAKAVPGSA